MKTMIRFSFTLFLCLLFFHVPAQDCILQLSEENNPIYVPPQEPISASTRMAEIVVEYVDEETWPPEVIGAFDFAVSIWEDLITSDVPIKIKANYEFITFDLGVAQNRRYTSAQFESNHPAYQENTVYASALANRLAGERIEEVEFDTEIWITPLGLGVLGGHYSGLDGNPPFGMTDLVTIILHEIGHGLGFVGSVTGSNNLGTANHTYPPDIGICTRQMVNGNGVKLEDFPSIPTFTTEIYDFITGDDVSWLSSSVADNAKLYAPIEFENGSTLSHVDTDTYEGTDNGLMKHRLKHQEAYHDPGPIGMAIMRDIGWDDFIVTGIEDKIYIKGFDEECYSSPYCSWSSWDELLYSPNTDLEIGSNFYYAIDFVDAEPYNYLLYGTFVTKLEVLHSEGRYLLDEFSGSFGDLEINDLPTGYKWSRDRRGKIRAEINTTGEDNDGYLHKAFLPITLNFQPEALNVKILDVEEQDHCDAVTLSFYARGASSYKVLYKSNLDNSFSVVDVPVGKLSHTIFGLSDHLDYEFQIEAKNEMGVTTSGSIFREKCCQNIIAHPNPVLNTLTAQAGDQIALKSISLINNLNPNISLLKEIENDMTFETTLDLNSFPQGTYTMMVTDIQGCVKAVPIIKILED